MTSTTTYQMKSELRCHSPCSPHSPRKNFDPQIETKNNLICQLKSHIFELEQREKDYNALEQRFTKLQNDICLEKQNKLNLENELKNKEDCYNKTLCNLNSDNEKLQLSYNEKMNENKNLFKNNECLDKEIEIKECQICELNKKVNELLCQLKNNDNQRADLKKTVDNLNATKNEQSLKICKLIEDNKKLTQVCQKQENDINMGNCEQQKLLKKLDENNFNINNLNNKLNEFINNENCLENNINNVNNKNLDLQSILKDYEKQFNVCKNENDNVKNNINKERSIRTDLARKCEQLGNILNNRNAQINKMCQEKENTQKLLEITSNKNCESQNVNNQLKNHINNLTVQNQNLMCEIENVIKEDEKMKSIINRKERICATLGNNKNIVEKIKGDFCEVSECNNGINNISPLRSTRVSCNSPLHIHYNVPEQG